MDAFWDRFLEEGDKLFNYMINNFKEMFEDETHIRHFIIRDGFYGCIEDKEKLMNNYQDNIQKELIEFIKKEYEEESLFDKTNWKPFRDSYYLSEMYFGYKKLFKFKHYYFQLAIDIECDIDNCRYCVTQYIPHFVAALYGWIDDTTDKLQPYKKVTILSDNIMPKNHWLYK